ncbi:MAG TPA: S41 family peptidase [Nevskiaceae bacterium]|nr:S41 family peptidase [Nevskiaceae bacterium]
MSGSLNGVWRSRGYGWLLRIDPHAYSLSHLSRRSCIPAERGAYATFAASFDRVEIDGDRLRLHQAGDLTRYEFVRHPSVPDVPVIEPGSLADAAVNFETLWRAFDEHYAFFALHGVDWLDLHGQLRARVTPEMSDAALLEVLSDLLRPLDDGHVSLSAPGGTIQTLKAMELREAMRGAFGMPHPRVSPQATVDAIAPKLDSALLSPFSTRSALQQAGNGIVSWCRLTPRVGYLNVLRLFGFADSNAARRANDLPHDRAEVAAFLRDDMVALESALDRVFTDLADCDALIVDLRVNGGGFDRAGLAIANRIADRKRVAFTKCARDGDGHTDAQAIHVEPGSRPGFTKPVHVLTSPLCVSAGEICVLGLRASPHVRCVGTPTAGMLSDNLNKILPNGWTYSLSNEVYTAADGEVYEGRGIPPHQPLALDAGALIESMRTQLANVLRNA